ncbi:uncharacterized protein LOC142353904 [Convolutriloba macropyga]|uniref:uncharacterized protein LOC142353904 n=1 Tax=Convolutriloba macropyga TaxID=536237 RepID=UPI003F51FC44
MTSRITIYLVIKFLLTAVVVNSQTISIVLNSADTTSATFNVTDAVNPTFPATIEEFQCLDSSGNNVSCTYSKNSAKENPATFTWSGLIAGAQYTLHIIRLEVNNETAGSGNPFSVTDGSNFTFCAVPNPPDSIDIVNGANDTLINVTISPSSLGGQVSDYRMEVFFPADATTAYANVTGLTNGEEINIGVGGALLRFRARSVDTCTPEGESATYIERFFMMPLQAPSGRAALILVRKNTNEMCFVWNADKEENSETLVEYNSVILQLMQGNPLTEVASTENTVNGQDDSGSICVASSAANPNQDVEILFSLKHADTTSGLTKVSPTRNETFNLAEYNMVSSVEIVCDFDADNCTIDIKFIADILPWVSNAYLNATWVSETTTGWTQMDLTAGVHCTDNTGVSGGTYDCVYWEEAANTTQLSFDVQFCALDTCLISLYTTIEGGNKNTAGTTGASLLLITTTWLAMEGVTSSP